MPGTPLPHGRGMSRAPTRTAYERLVDRLLASPHFGERWGRHWLDLARYAELRRLRGGQAAPERLVLARLGHRRGERRHAVRPVHGAAAGGGPARRRRRLEIGVMLRSSDPATPLLQSPTLRRSADRHRLPPQYAHEQRGRGRPGGVPRQGGLRPREHDGQRVARADARLRPVPPPPVRPRLAAGVLRALRLLQQRGGDGGGGAGGTRPAREAARRSRC